MLKVVNVVVKIGEFTILRGVRLEVPEKSIVALVGGNGAGKTTMLRSIMGLVPVVSGAITLDGHHIEHLSPQDRAQLGIGYLPEDRRLIGSLTVLENILMPAWAVGLRAPEVRATAICARLPEVEAVASRKAAALSGGQQKLVALARSFMNARKLLLLDEPFEGISTVLSRRLAAVVKELQGQVEGLAVLVAESDSKRARMLTDKIYVIERGEVVEEAGTDGA